MQQPFQTKFDEEFAELPLFLFREPRWTRYHEKQAVRSFDNFLRMREPEYRRAARTSLRLEFEQYEIAVRDVLREMRGAGGVERKQTEEEEEEINNALLAAAAVGAGFWTSRFISEHESTVRILLARMRGQIDVGLVVSDDIIQELIRERAEFLADRVTGTNTEAVLFEVLRGMERGETTSEIMQRIRSIRTEGLFAGNLSVPQENHRVRMIAEMESSHIINGASLEAAKSSEEDLRKQWMSQRDNRVRPTHVIQDDGQFYKLDEEFPVVGVLHPPGGWGCRCFMLYHRVNQDN